MHSNGTLTLHGMTGDRQGTYSCIASNGPLTLMTAATVNVKGKFEPGMRYNTAFQFSHSRL